MPIQVDSDSLEARIIKLLQNQDDAITLKEAAKKLNVSESKLEKTVKSLASRGIVNIDVLPDKKYLRLGRSDIQLQGTKSSQKKAVKRKRGKQKEKGSKKSRDMMFG